MYVNLDAEEGNEAQMSADMAQQSYTNMLKGKSWLAPTHFLNLSQLEKKIGGIRVRL